MFFLLRLLHQLLLRLLGRTGGTSAIQPAARSTIAAMEQSSSKQQKRAANGDAVKKPDFLEGAR